ncbi:MAG: hypothetical protein SCALA702_35070 [Melioribacteraceae bacterium]|nr:MAG: hypothetical protein SCALA702_35070 [Melioribacteraceae bacterium]
MRVLKISIFVIIADQLTKLFVKGFSIPFLGISVDGMRYGSSIEVLGNFFKITFVENPGMAFGIDVGESSKLFLSLFSLFASIGILIYLFRIQHERYVVRLALALIFAGAVGNLIDRMFYGVFYDYAPLFYGKVVDFLNVDFFDFTIFGHTYERWPIFNIADSSVSIGVVLLLIFQSKTEPSNEENEGDEEIQQDLPDADGDGEQNESEVKKTEETSEKNDDNEENVTKSEDNRREEFPV